MKSTTGKKTKKRVRPDAYILGVWVKGTLIRYSETLTDYKDIKRKRLERWGTETTLKIIPVLITPLSNNH